MSDMKRTIRAMGLAVATAWGVNSAMAQATYQIDAGGLENFNLSMDGSSINNALAGGILLNHVSGTGSSFTSVCTDIYGTLYLGNNYSYAAPSPFSSSTGLDPTWGAGNKTGLVNTVNELAAIQAAAYIYYTYGSILSSTSTSQSVLDQKAGLQLAIWAALYNTVGGSTPSTSLDGSRFDVLSASAGTWSGSWGQTYAGTTSAITYASNYISAVDSSPVHFSYQYSGDVMIPSPTTQYGLTPQEVLAPVTPVPEPTTWIAGSLLFLPFVASAIRSRSRRLAVARWIS